MYTKSFILAALACSAEAFAPAAFPAAGGLKLRAGACAVSGLRMVNEDRRDGFGGGHEAIKEVIEKRSKDDWGQGYGGSKGETYKGPASFEEYLKKRAAESGGKVTDAAGNDISNSKPTYEIAEGTWGPPPGGAKEVDPLAWIDKSVAGFEKVDTSDLIAEDAEAKAWREQKAAEKAAQEAEVEARMQKWLAEAEAKKRAGQ